MIKDIKGFEHREVDSSLPMVKRRTMLQWLGASIVLPLSGQLVAACRALSPAGGAGDGGSVDGGGLKDTDLCGPEGPPKAFPFQPGSTSQPIFNGWGERTVDQQNLTEILAQWRLEVNGLVKNAMVFDFADLLCLPRQDQTTDFHCVEGWSIYDVPWNGFHLSQIVRLVEPLSSASHVTIYSSKGLYMESLPMSVAIEPRTLLAYGIGGTTIPLRHGFALRFVIPRLWGYKNAKYVNRIEFADGPVNGFWERYGYTYEGEVPASRLRPGKY